MTDVMMNRIGVQHILSAKVPITIDTMLNFDGESLMDPAYNYLGQGAPGCNEQIYATIPLTIVLKVWLQFINVFLLGPGVKHTGVLRT